MTIRNFEDLEIWKNARVLVQNIYIMTLQEPFSKDYGLVNQIRRASVSIMANIAEGFEREGSGELIQFLSIAKGSCGEVRCHLIVAFDQGYIRDEQFANLADNAKKLSIMIRHFIDYLKEGRYKGMKFKKSSSPLIKEDVRDYLDRRVKE